MQSGDRAAREDVYHLDVRHPQRLRQKGAELPLQRAARTKVRLAALARASDEFLTLAVHGDAKHLTKTSARTETSNWPTPDRRARVYCDLLLLTYERQREANGHKVW